jgi:ribosomal subunit interface protein
MKTDVAILHNEYPTHVREDVAGKLQQLAKYFERTVSIRALLERQKETHRVELVANVGQGVVLVVDAREESVRHALDEAMSRMARVLKRHKAKLTNERRRMRTR